MITEVRELGTNNKLYFTTSPREAVVGAFERSHNRNNTWQWPKFEDHPEAIEAKFTVACGDFCAKKRLMYLWVNITDLTYDSLQIVPFGSILNMFIRPELGDKLLPGCWYADDKLDDNFVIIECIDNRAEAIKDALELIGQRKINRKIRMRITTNLPRDEKWTYVPDKKEEVMDFDEQIYEQKVDGLNVTMGELLSIDDAQLTDEYSTQASRYAYLAMKLAEAEALYNEAKTERDRMYSEVELDYREEYKDQKTTEAYIRSLVVTDKDYLKVLEQENEAFKHYRILRALTDAMKQRADMLISLGATRRQEYEMTNMNIRTAKEKLVEIKNGE